MSLGASVPTNVVVVKGPPRKEVSHHEDVTRYIEQLIQTEGILDRLLKLYEAIALLGKQIKNTDKEFDEICKEIAKHRHSTDPTLATLDVMKEQLAAWEKNIEGTDFCTNIEIIADDNSAENLRNIKKKNAVIEETRKNLRTFVNTINNAKEDDSFSPETLEYLSTAHRIFKDVKNWDISEEDRWEIRELCDKLKHPREYTLEERKFFQAMAEKLNDKLGRTVTSEQKKQIDDLRERLRAKGKIDNYMHSVVQLRSTLKDQRLELTHIKKHKRLQRLSDFIRYGSWVFVGFMALGSLVPMIGLAVLMARRIQKFKTGSKHKDGRREETTKVFATRIHNRVANVYKAREEIDADPVLQTEALCNWNDDVARLFRVDIQQRNVKKTLKEVAGAEDFLVKHGLYPLNSSRLPPRIDLRKPQIPILSSRRFEDAYR